MGFNRFRFYLHLLCYEKRIKNFSSSKNSIYIDHAIGNNQSKNTTYFLCIVYLYNGLNVFSLFLYINI